MLVRGRPRFYRATGLGAGQVNGRTLHLCHYPLLVSHMLMAASLARQQFFHRG
jgi:hypothetical protein